MVAKIKKIIIVNGWYHEWGYYCIILQYPILNDWIGR